MDLLEGVYSAMLLVAPLTFGLGAVLSGYNGDYVLAAVFAVVGLAVGAVSRYFWRGGDTSFSWWG